MKGFTKFLIQRLISLVPTILGLIILTFFLSHVIPGNPALILGGQEVVENPTELHALEAELGLTKPLYVQFWIYLTQLAHFNLGYDYFQGQYIGHEIAMRLPVSIELAIATMLIGLPIAIISGIFAALRTNKPADHAARVGTLVGISMPVYWIGLILIIVFYEYLHIAPAPFGQLSPFVKPPTPITGFVILDSLIEGNISALASSLWHIILPVMALSFAVIGTVSRIMRSSLLEVINKDYMRTAFAIGYPRNILINKYAMRNALLPVLTVVAIQVGGLMGGVVLTETIFSWPGLGLYTYDAIYNLDYGAIMAVVIVSGFLYVIVNLLADIMYGVIDPRVKY